MAINALIDFGTDFADLLDDWTGTRAGVGSDNTEGVYVPGTPTPLSFKATPPQPINQNEVVMDEGGEFIRSAEKAYTPDDVRNNDIVTYDGVKMFRVLEDGDRLPLGGHKKIYLVKVQNDN